ncbi:MAG TPA: DegT/DnrJ/EryC1/StrS family aminotransferase [Burkholderiales bacterium]|nr:DegT/DnrJ/EryC1/StrS family aminotransferase [Burkholderiales bacterium]
MNTAHRFYPVAEPDIGALEERYLLDAFRSGWISSLGEYIGRFEQSFAAFCGAEHGVAVSNGTVALQLALLAAGVGPGDEVIVPPLTFVATASAVRHVGAVPVFADCEPDIGTLDAREVEKALSARTKAIVPVHLYGHPADMDPIMAIARDRNLVVIEDAAEAHGALYKGRKVGGIGHIATFSFYGNKIITTGEGGMVVTADARVASRIRFLKDHAMDPARRYWHPEVGYNFRMTNLQAAVGCAQLERFEEITSKRQRVQDAYRSRLESSGTMAINPAKAWARPVPWLVCGVLARDSRPRDEFAAELRKRGIDSRPYFGLISDMPPYASAAGGADFPVARDLSLRGLNLPSSTALDDRSVGEVCATIADLLVRDAPAPSRSSVGR